MFEEKDYYMRIVHELVRMLIRLVFNKDIDRDEEEAVPLEVMEKYKKLISMIDDGQINEAENLLLDGLEPEDNEDIGNELCPLCDGCDEDPEPDRRCERSSQSLKGQRPHFL